MRRKNEANAEERGRWSSRKKMDAVLRLLKGEEALPQEASIQELPCADFLDRLLAEEAGCSRRRRRELRTRDGRAPESEHPPHTSHYNSA